MNTDDNLTGEEIRYYRLDMLDEYRRWKKNLFHAYVFGCATGLIVGGLLVLILGGML